jgi:hypothetical protein
VAEYQESRDIGGCFERQQQSDQMRFAENRAMWQE